MEDNVTPLVWTPSVSNGPHLSYSINSFSLSFSPSYLLLHPHFRASREGGGIRRPRSGSGSAAVRGLRRLRASSTAARGLRRPRATDTSLARDPPAVGDLRVRALPTAGELRQPRALLRASCRAPPAPQERHERWRETRQRRERRNGSGAVPSLEFEGRSEPGSQGNIPSGAATLPPLPIQTAAGPDPLCSALQPTHG
jgi:hypothetical protein